MPQGNHNANWASDTDNYFRAIMDFMKKVKYELK
jgi:hypothetical protein